MRRVALAPAKINLALAVGPPREDGMHPIASVVQRVGLHDRLELEPSRTTAVTGFAEDTLVSAVLERLAEAAGGGAWHVRLTKEIPVAAGLGGGSADAAVALELANATLPEPLGRSVLKEIAAGVGADVPFFLEPGPQLAEGYGERLRALDLPQDFWVLLALPPGAAKESTGDVYRRFDQLDGASGFAARRRRILAVIEGCTRARDLAELPPNDLGAAAGGGRFAALLRELGAFRADVSGAGPVVYGLFEDRRAADAAAVRLPTGTRHWVVPPVW